MLGPDRTTLRPERQSLIANLRASSLRGLHSVLPRGETVHDAIQITLLGAGCMPKHFPLSRQFVFIQACGLASWVLLPTSSPGIQSKSPQNSSLDTYLKSCLHEAGFD